MSAEIAGKRRGLTAAEVVALIASNPSEPGGVDGWRQTGVRIPQGNSTSMGKDGLMSTSTHTDTSSGAGVAGGNGARFLQTLAASTHGGIETGTGFEYTKPSLLPTLRGVLEIYSTGGSPGVRAWCGMTNAVGVAGMTASNDVAGKHVGIQFCDDRDTNWMVAHSDGTQTLVDTGIAFAFDVIFAFEIEFTGTGSTCTVRFWDTRDATNVFSTNITTRLPAVTDSIGDTFGIVNDFAPLVDVDWAHYIHRVWTKPLFLEPTT